MRTYIAISLVRQNSSHDNWKFQVRTHPALILSYRFQTKKRLKCKFRTETIWARKTANETGISRSAFSRKCRPGPR